MTVAILFSWVASVHVCIGSYPEASLPLAAVGTRTATVLITAPFSMHWQAITAHTLVLRYVNLHFHLVMFP